MPEANALAYAMFGLWPVVTWVLFRRLDTTRALIWALLGGYLLLPPALAINLPMVPDFTKFTVPSLAAFACLWLRGGVRPALDPGGWLMRGLMVLLVASALGTVLTNAEPIPFAAGALPGLRLYDSLAAMASQAIVLLPFLMARRHLATEGAIRALLLALVAAGLAYSLPMLVEAALSPQINIWVYGYFQHDFFQTIRAGGYRPLVFLPHGLWVALFAMMAAAAAAALLRAAPAEARPRALAVLCYLAAMVLVCKSLGAMLFAAAALPLLLFAPQRMVVLVAAGLAAVVLAYPVLRGAHLVPLGPILDLAARISPERAASLAFRLMNEEELLAHAAAKPIFGWGGYDRSFVIDPISGAARVIADGAWVIVLGMGGWAAYVATFGILALPLLRLGAGALRGRGRELSQPVAALALILGFNMVDLLPNATAVPLTWLMAGALWGVAERQGRDEAAQGAKKPRPLRVIVG